MDAKYYCDNLYLELTELKAKIHDIIKAMGQQPDAVRQRLEEQTDELHLLVDDLTHKINELKTQCPTDWSSHKKEIEAKKKALIERINLWDPEHIIGG
jgi:hypothetical protein